MKLRMLMVWTVFICFSLPIPVSVWANSVVSKDINRSHDQRKSNSIPSAIKTKQKLAASSAGAEHYPKRIIGKDGVPMVLVPAGWFITGRRNEESFAKPKHETYLDGFYIDKYPVTNEMFRAKGMKPAKNAGSKFNGPKQPVVGVTWFQAKDYCQRVNKRLPNEAVWEKTARGTDGRAYPWGNKWDSTKLIWKGNSGGRTHSVDRSYNTHQSPFGAVDMVGNVWEWVDGDGYPLKNYRYHQPKRIPPGVRFPVILSNEIILRIGRSGEGYYREIRGGSWHDGTPIGTSRTVSRGLVDEYSTLLKEEEASKMFRVTRRSFNDETGKLFREVIKRTGFRCAMSLEKRLRRSPQSP